MSDHADAVARMWAYHEHTKHSVERLQRSAHGLDWDNQPNPFRAYQGARLVALDGSPELPAIGTFEAMRRVAADAPADRVEPLTLADVGRLLYYSMAISAWKEVRGGGYRYSLRVNPSSGNLHPTETYVLSRGRADWPAGVDHYRVDEHALERRRDGDAVERLSAACRDDRVADAEIVVVLTSVFWREAWKYRDRAYRYCLHDAGHAAASVLIAAAGLGCHGYVIGRFVDKALAELIGAAGSDERPLVVLPIFTSAAGGPRAADASDAPLSPLHGEPNRLSAEVVAYPSIEAIQAATCLDESAGFVPVVSADGAAGPRRAPRFKSDPPLAEIVRRRRSAIDFDPSFSIDAATLHALLAAGFDDFPADFRGNAGGGAGADLIRAFVYVHSVSGLSPGVYRHDRIAGQLECLHSGDVRRLAARLSLGQVLAGHAVAAFSMIADLAGAARRFGPRGYRYAHFEAGFIGQRLYLAAEALGFNSTGIGAFFDDEVHTALGLTRDTGQVIYHFATGRAQRDDRIVTVVPPPTLVKDW